VISTRDYEIIEEVANMMHVFVRIIRSYVSVLKRHIIMYRAETEGSRAVMICYLTLPYPKIPMKKSLAQQVLETYKQTSFIRISP